MKKVIFLDTNVILRYLLKDKPEQFNEIKETFSLLKTGKIKGYILSEVLLETYYVLVSFYNVPKEEALISLKKLLLYKGFIGKEKEILLNAIDYVLNYPKVSLLDWVLCLKSKQKNGAILTFDKILAKNCDSNL
ncbi:PIN domain-containing protein [Deferribacter thermophilus]|uniref:PIN domain-containing protein n=1 Tax=Deferribacter thermophilus TaxID=53573 RepID=UPI003C181CA3